MRRAASRATLLALATVALAACDEGSAPPPAVLPSAAPSVQPATVPALLQPPSAPLTPADTSAAAMALAAAGARTGQAGSLRMKLVAHVGAPKAARSLDVTGTGESESATRSRVLVVVSLSGRTVTTESEVYDGAFYSHGEGQPWRRVSSRSASSADPRSYVNFASGSHGVVDAGPGVRDGAAAEQYQALASGGGGGGGSQAAGPAPAISPTSLPIKVTAWVDQAHGRLVGMDLRFPDIGAGPGLMSIDFFDFGAAIKLTPPTPAP